jgi:hypothetical protein
VPGGGDHYIPEALGNLDRFLRDHRTGGFHYPSTRRRASSSDSGVPGRGLIAELRDRLLVQRVPPQDGEFLFVRVVPLPEPEQTGFFRVQLKHAVGMLSGAS